jgi:hypothetical protein
MAEIEDALRQIERFRGQSLAETISKIESRLTGAKAQNVAAVNTGNRVDASLIAATAQVKRASAQIDVVIHAVGILYALPHILEKDEILESTSLGAGNAGSDFDVVTDRRIAEFKFIYWQGGSESLRKKTFFQDYFKLIREQSQRAKYFYLLNTEIPLRFLSGTSRSLRMLDRNRRLADAYERLYGNRYQTVGEFYRAHKENVKFVNLVGMVPGLEHFIGLPTDQDDDVNGSP